MAINLANFGIVQGNLSRDPKFYYNSDGSRKIFLTVACRDNFARKDGAVGTQFVDLQAFIPKGSSMGPLGHLKKGDHVTLAYTVVSRQYEKDGRTVYEQTLRVYGNEMILPPKGANGKNGGWTL